MSQYLFQFQDADGLAYRLKVLASELEPDRDSYHWKVELLTESAARLRRMEKGLQLILSGTPEERRAFCAQAGVEHADSKAIATAAVQLPGKS